MAGDRISEAYLGKMSERMLSMSHERVHWIISRIKGLSVLDVGCSQGIVEYLIGDKINITGIDNDRDAIAYAENLVSEKEFRDNIVFINDDFLAHDFGNSQFDCIIMTEVLEHLYVPEDFLKKAASMMMEGQLIVTVPFGINRHPDHKQTFYIKSIVEKVSEYFYVDSVTIVGNCIGIEAFANGKTGLGIGCEEIVQLEEKAFYCREDEYLARISSGKTELDTIKNSNNSLKETYLNLKDSYERICEESDRYKVIYDEYQKRCGEYQERCNEYQERCHEYQESYNEYRSRCDEYKNIIEEKEVESKSFKASYESLSKEASEMRIGLENDNNKLRAQIETLKILLKDEERKGKELEKKAAKVKIPYSEKRAAFLESSEPEFFNSIKDEVALIPTSNSGRYYERFDVSIGIISDEFLYDSWKDAANFVYLTPENWTDSIEKTEFLIVASTWKGLNDVWKGAAYEGKPQREILLSVIEAYKKANKTVVFYSKEDPPNYDSFIAIAQKSDYIFTTCKEIVQRYKNDCNNSNVDVLCFSINPLFHNPVGIHTKYRKNEVIFSGSWMNKYPSRQTDIQILLDGVISAGKKLHIIDRNYEIESENYLFPEKYWKSISPSIAHDQLQNVHKLYDWSIDINSINESETMFANRGYELLASGNILISNYSVGVNNKLPWIFTAASEKEIKEVMNSLGDEERYKWQIDGVRSVMTGETCFDRLQQVLNRIEIDAHATTRTVLVVADVIDDIVKRQFEYQSYPYKTLIAEAELTEEIYSKYDIIACWESGHEYAPFYLEDMINAFKYTSGEYITKDAFLCNGILSEGKEHEFVSKLGAKHRTIFWRQCYSYSQYNSLEDQQDLENGYSIDHFNYDEIFIHEDKANRRHSITVVTYTPENIHSLRGKLIRSVEQSDKESDVSWVILSDNEEKVKIAKQHTYPMDNVAYVTGISIEDAMTKAVEDIDGDFTIFIEPHGELYINNCLNAVSNEATFIAGNSLVVKPTKQSGEYSATIKQLPNDKHSSDMLIRSSEVSGLISTGNITFDSNRFNISFPDNVPVFYTDLVLSKTYYKGDSPLDIMYYGKFNWIESNDYKKIWQKLVSEASKSMADESQSPVNWQKFFDEIASLNADSKTIESQEKTIAKQKKTINVQKEKISDLDSRVEHLEKSYSYKLGLFLTYIPRRIVHLLRK